MIVYFCNYITEISLLSKNTNTLSNSYCSNTASTDGYQSLHPAWGYLVHIVLSLISKVMMAKQLVSLSEKSLKIIEKFTFWKTNQPLSSGEDKWRCTVKTCTAFLKTVGDDEIITELNLNHSHKSLGDQKQFVTGVVKLKATEDICTKPSKIFCTAIKNVPLTEHLQVSDVGK
ncbi:unnamed protein product [Macrosiphum euphorbiae]|uniref:FLYWCH-type domain-containing protein n=1 Tax=Macrosiphum euphorbiae TaxID=13131 RepID=A0AAV0WPW9_9HEMI|nr:unnamed protein product [Macrosiphum euphorbiae]